MTLDAYLAEQQARPFSWSRNNCCHFVAGWVAHITGTDPMAGLPYTHSQHAARRLTRQLGGTLADAWARRLGREPVAAALAQVGDVVLVPVGADGAAVGICTGRHVALLTLADGLTHLPMTQATHAWRVTP
jgi:hypothetical protein